jgi:hypothetical protein
VAIQHSIAPAPFMRDEVLIPTCRVAEHLDGGLAIRRRSRAGRDRLPAGIAYFHNWLFTTT